MSSHFHSASQSCTILSANCRYNLRLFRLFRGDSSGIDKSSSATCLLYSDVVKGEPRPTQLRKYQEEDQKGNQGVGDFRFINILQLVLFISFSQFFLYVFYPRHLPTPTTHDIYPHPRPTTSTHYPRPTTFSYTQFGGLFNK